MDAWDPTGEKARAVKRRYQGLCRGCGAPTAARGGKDDAYQYCKRCRPGAIAPTRTRDWVRDAMHEWRERYGRPPSSTDWSRTHAGRRGGEALERFEAGDWPAPSTLVDMYGSWAALTLTRSRTTDGQRSSGAIGRRARYLPTEVPDWLTQRNHAPDRDTATVDGWHELQVANPTFLLERLGSECTDLQGLRELTVNGLDAIDAQGPGASGRVVWDLDWHRFDASGGRVRKLSITDTGTGMTPEQLSQYINQLASSGREQSASGNFGVGAKVAAGSRNPHGLEYRSWHQGQGALICFKRHPDGRWGLEPQRWPDGHSDYWQALDEQDKPWLLRGQDHGTQVVLLGRHERHDTTQPPDSVTDGRGHWITRYLNARFVRLPEQVEVLVRERHGRDQPGQLQPIHGEQHHLQRHAVAAGAVDLSDAIAHWWVLDDDHRARRRESSLWSSAGHAAAVYCDELYDILPQTRGGYGRLQDFGIRFGYERGRTSPRTARRGGPSAVQHRADAAASRPRAAAMGSLGRGVRCRDARRDPATPRTRRPRRLRPTPGGDPPARHRDPAALPPQPLPPKRTTPPGAHPAGGRRARPAARHAHN